MPRRIPREQAVAALGHRGCVMCALLEGHLGAPLWLHRGAEAVALLPRMAVRWGHALVTLPGHVTHFTDVSPRAWSAMADLARRVAVVLEAELQPARCYVASLGTARDDLPMTCPHLHLHVLPVMDVDARPREVLTWSDGVWTADEAEWLELRDRLRHRLAEVT